MWTGLSCGSRIALCTRDPFADSHGPALVFGCSKLTASPTRHSEAGATLQHQARLLLDSVTTLQPKTSPGRIHLKLVLHRPSPLHKPHQDLQHVRRSTKRAAADIRGCHSFIVSPRARHKSRLHRWPRTPHREEWHPARPTALHGRRDARASTRMGALIRPARGPPVLRRHQQQSPAQHLGAPLRRRAVSQHAEPRGAQEAQQDA
jgi:hypothetical protein